MENPFEQFRPDSEQSQKIVEENVMSSIHLKVHLAHILEFFLAIFGTILRGSITNLAPDDRANTSDEEYFF